jgi:MoxR-like ATPase
VRRKLKALVGWKAYREAQGWTDNNQSSRETRDACEALGLDLEAEWQAFLAMSPDARATARSEALANDGAEALAKAGEDDARDDTEGDSEGAPGVTGVGYEGRSPDEVISEALASVSAHMTPHLAQQLPALLAPLAMAAVQGPRTVIKTVQLAAPAAPGAWTPPSVSVVKRLPLWQAFGLRSSKSAPQAWRYALETTYAGVCDYAGAPAVDPDYVWNAAALAQLGAADAGGINAWLYGAAGTGKTEGAMQYAARLGRPFVRIAIDRTTEAPDIIGQEVPSKDGGTTWRDGKLLRAFRIPYCVILIDEPSFLRPSVLALFQTALDTRQITYHSNEVCDAAPGIFVMAADNTAGMGDDSGRYGDTAPLNAAFMDRFGPRIPFVPLPAAQEATMVSHRAGVPLDAARAMVDYANLTRGEATAGTLTMGVTPRRLLAWASACRHGVPSSEAFVAAIINGAAAEDTEKLSMLASTSLASSHARIDGLVRGTWQEPAPASEPPPAPSYVGADYADDQR